MTLGGLLALGYTVVVSYKRSSTSVSDGNLSMSLESIDTLGETYMVLRGTNRKVWTCSLNFLNIIMHFSSLLMIMGLKLHYSNFVVEQWKMVLFCQDTIAFVNMEIILLCTISFVDSNRNICRTWIIYCVAILSEGTQGGKSVLALITQRNEVTYTIWYCVIVTTRQSVCVFEVNNNLKKKASELIKLASTIPVLHILLRQGKLRLIVK